MRWMNLESIIQSEVRKRKINIVYNAYIYGIQEDSTKESICRATMEKPDINNRFMDMGRGEERVRRMKRVTWKHTLCKVDSQREFAIALREIKHGLSINLQGWDGEGNGREVI